MKSVPHTSMFSPKSRRDGGSYTTRWCSGVCPGRWAVVLLLLTLSSFAAAAQSGDHA